MTGRRRRFATPRRLYTVGIAVLLVAALLSGACSSDDAQPAPAATGESTTVPTTTTAGEPTMTSPSNPPDADTGPSFGTANTDLMAQLAQSTENGPFFMVNLIKFRDQAVYADGRETDLTGEEANNLYTTTGVQLLIEGAMRPAMFGSVVIDPASPPVPAWDQVAIARYPSYADFFAMASDPAFQEGAEHKDAGVETSSVIVTHRVVDAPPATDLPAGDAPVILFELFSHSGTGTADRPESLSAYLDGLAPLVTANGGVALGTYEVVGTLIGDGREWDEAHLWWFPDQSSLDALLADPDLAELTAARDADLEDLYRLALDSAVVEPLGREP